MRGWAWRSGEAPVLGPSHMSCLVCRSLTIRPALELQVQGGRKLELGLGAVL